MMARGFKPVGWVAGVAAAALGCYMLSLNVASERAELAKLERNIILTKQDIRTLQTELETRGRLQQLESWNANVLALSAPTSAQFLDNEVTLARFDQREATIDERSAVHMASAAPSTQSVQQKVEAPVRYASAPAVTKRAQPLVHQASLIVEEPQSPVAAAIAAGANAGTKAVEAAKPVAQDKKVASLQKSASVVKTSDSTPKKSSPSLELANETRGKAGSTNGQ